MALNRVGEEGPGPTSAASELGGRGWGMGAGRQEKAKGRGFFMAMALTRSCDTESKAPADKHQHRLPSMPTEGDVEFSSCLNALVTFCSQTSGPSFQINSQQNVFTIPPPLTSCFQRHGNHALSTGLLQVDNSNRLDLV